MHVAGPVPSPPHRGGEGEGIGGGGEGEGEEGEEGKDGGGAQARVYAVSSVFDVNRVSPTRRMNFSSVCRFGKKTIERQDATPWAS